jgi:aspartate-semialdehyde dehydrogenase
VIQTIDESSFDGARFVFFAGSPKSAAAHEASAVRAGATVIDLTGRLGGEGKARRWIPRLDAFLPAPAAADGSNGQIKLCIAPPTPAIVACSLSAALGKHSLARMTLTFLQPVSERGQAGVDELEGQTGKLLTLQPMPQEVFDTQVAFNLVNRWGAQSSESLADVRTAVASEVRRYLGGRAVVPAMNFIQAPVFYGYGFACYAEFPTPQDEGAIAENLDAAGFTVAGEDEPGPSNVSVAGEERASIGRAQRDANVECGYWFWGAADNLRVATANAVRIAENLLVD